MSSRIFEVSTPNTPRIIIFQILKPNPDPCTHLFPFVYIPGFLLYSTWAWNVICAPDVFSWNFIFMLLNMGQTLYIIYQMRPVKVNRELELMYETLFQPLNVSWLCQS